MESGEKPATATLTANANTPPGTVLKTGETWKQDGLELTLVRLRYGARGPKEDVKPDWALRNSSMDHVTFQIDTFDIIIVDNNGNIYHQTDNCKHLLDLEPGEFANPDFGCYAGYNFTIEYYKPSVQYLDVIAQKYGRITDAHWRVPIQH